MDLEYKKAEELVLNNLEAKVNCLLEKWERKGHVYNLDRDQLCLIVIDMQHYYCSASLGIDFININSVIDNINKLVEVCHKNKIPVIWIRMNFNKDESGDDAGLYTNLHRRPLSEGLCNERCGTEVYNKLKIDLSKDHQILKKRYSAMINKSSVLEEKLKELNRKQLMVTGILTNVCVESTIRDAMQLDYEVVVVRDGTTSIDKVLHEVSLLNIRLFFGDVYGTDELIETIEK